MRKIIAILFVAILIYSGFAYSQGTSVIGVLERSEKAMRKVRTCNLDIETISSWDAGGRYPLPTNTITLHEIIKLDRGSRRMFMDSKREVDIAVPTNLSIQLEEVVNALILSLGQEMEVYMLKNMAYIGIKGQWYEKEYSEFWRRDKGGLDLLWHSPFKNNKCYLGIFHAFHKLKDPMLFSTFITKEEFISGKDCWVLESNMVSPEYANDIFAGFISLQGGVLTNLNTTYLYIKTWIEKKTGYVLKFSISINVAARYLDIPLYYGSTTIIKLSDFNRRIVMKLPWATRSALNWGDRPLEYLGIAAKETPAPSISVETPDYLKDEEFLKMEETMKDISTDTAIPTEEIKIQKDTAISTEEIQMPTDMGLPKEKIDIEDDFNLDWD